MRLLFLYGEPASGKLTVARAVAARTGFALFHNHLVVDAVAALFPFGSPPFVEWRERLWLDMIGAAAEAGRSTIFTFAPEPTVRPGFAARLARRVAEAGGEVLFVALTVDAETQATRLTAEDRAAFGKLRSTELLASLKPAIAACMADMPAPALTIDTGLTSAGDAAARIVDLIGAEG